MFSKPLVGVALAAAAAALFAAPAVANSVPVFGTSFGLASCVATPCTSTLPAGEPFTVRGGFTSEPRSMLVDPQHRFELWVDGVLAHGITDLDLREPSKWYVFNFRAGMTGVHDFVGCWYGGNGALIFCGSRAVMFVGSTSS